GPWCGAAGCAWHFWSWPMRKRCHRMQFSVASAALLVQFEEKIHVSTCQFEVPLGLPICRVAQRGRAEGEYRRVPRWPTIPVRRLAPSSLAVADEAGAQSENWPESAPQVGRGRRNRKAELCCRGPDRSAGTPVGGNHRFAHMQEARCKSVGADALCSDAGSLQKEM